MKNEKLSLGRILVIPIQVHQMKALFLFFFLDFPKSSAAWNPFSFAVWRSEIALAHSELTSFFGESR